MKYKIDGSEKVEAEKAEGVWEITHENIALSRIKYGREGMAIDDVSKLFGLSVAQYNKEVDITIKFCGENGTSFAELRGEG